MGTFMVIVKKRKGTMNNSRVPIAWKIHCVYRRVRRWVTQWGAFTKAWAPCWVARSRCIPPATKGNIPLYFEKFVIFFSSSESNQGLLVDNGAKRPIRRLSFLIHWKAHTKTRVKIFPNKKFLKKWERVGKTNQGVAKGYSLSEEVKSGSRGKDRVRVYCRGLHEHLRYWQNSW